MADEIDTLLVETTPRAMRIALMAGDRLAELHIDRPARGHRVGDVFVGRVTRVVPGLKAAFVDLGENVEGFLRAKEADVERSGEAISKLVQEGAWVAVQIKADAHDDKGPVLTRRFDDPDGALASDAMRVDPPRLISRSEPLLHGLAGRYPEARVIADTPSDVVPLKQRKHTGEIVLHQGVEPLFESAGVEDQIERALAERIRLTGGVELLFEPGRTLTAIDVDSAAASEKPGDALAINLDCVPVIARQVRLRNLAGLIAIDFLNMKDRDDGATLMKSLSRHLQHDPRETALDGPSRFGLVQIARQRQGPDLAGAMGSPVERATDALVRRLRQETRSQGGASFEIRASPEVARAFQGDDDGASIARWVGRRIELVVDKVRPHDRFDVGQSL